MNEEKKSTTPTERIMAYNASLTPEERVESARRAGQASAKARRRMRSMREAAIALLSAREPDRETRKRLAELGLDESVQDGLLLAMRESAKGGSVEAAKFLRDTSGQAPREVKDVRVSADLGLREMSTEDLVRLAEEDEVDE